MSEGNPTPCRSCAHQVGRAAKRFGVVVIGLCTLGGCTQSPQQAFYASCKEKVTAQLRAPATAKFPDQQHIWLAKSGSAAYLDGHVDAQNAYGALIRTQFRCGRDLGRFKGVHAVVLKDPMLSRNDEKWRDLLPEVELLYEGVKAQTEELRGNPETATLLSRWEAQLERARSSYEYAKVFAAAEERSAKEK